MADKITNKSELKLVAGFYDNDTRTITLDNPRNNLTAGEIKTFGNAIRTNQAILGDKGGAAFVGFKSAKVSTKTITQLDLT